MAPPKKDVRKNAWAWAENAPADYEISTNDVCKVYRMDIPKCIFGSCKRNCKNNPFCLTAIGESRWLSDVPETVTDIEDPAEEKRQERNFVGLKNLGATCYVNSLLQLWFHNSAFREAIFSWDPTQDPKEKENPTLVIQDDEILFTPQTVVGHLQVLFAMLALSEKRVVDPTDLVVSLGLDTSEQQDAQEFSKLFLSLLEDKYRDQINPSMTNFIQQNFCGEYAYVTRCSKCLTESTRSSQFYELDLNILGMKTLRESLADFLKEEKLEGDNMYFCNACNKKQSAERFIKLKHLPPTLCFQLMRFVFDRQKGKKKKLTSHLQFPETIDMTEYIENSSGPYVYNLSAVLIHKGPGAHSGHYIAHILTSQGWYKFNDENIENMDGKKLKFGEDDMDDFLKKTKAPRVPKGSLASSNAYMLVYTLQKNEDNDPDRLENPAILSSKVREKLNPRVLQVVEEKNSHFKKWMEEIQKCRDLKLDKSLQMKEEVASILRILPVQEENTFDLVPVSWLNQWLSKDGSKPVDPINNLPLLCSHNKINPYCVHDAKYINSAAADKLYEQFNGGPRLKLLPDACKLCIRNEFTLIKLRAKTAEEQKTISLLTKYKMDENMPGFWVSRKSLKSWRRIVLERAEKKLNINIKNNNKEDQEEPCCSSSSDKDLNGKAEPTSSKLVNSETVHNLEREESSSKLLNSDNTPIIKINSSGNETHAAEVPTSSKSSVEKTRSLRPRSKEEEVSSSIELSSDQVKTEHDILVTLSPRCPPIPVSPRTHKKIMKVRECNQLLNLFHENVQSVKETLMEDVKDEMKVIESQIDESTKTIASGVTQMKRVCTVLLDDILKKRQNQFVRRQLPFKSEPSSSNHEITPTNSAMDVVADSSNHAISLKSKERKNYLAASSSSNCNDYSDSEGDMSPIVGRDAYVKRSNEGELLSEGDASPIVGREASIKRSNEGELLNGCAKRMRSDSSIKTDNDAELFEEFEDLNDDIVCEHGNLCFQENLRRLVPCDVWNIMSSYFPLAKAFPKEVEPCFKCEGLANEDNFAKDRLKQEALKQKECLGELLLRSNNETSKLNLSLDASRVYLISSDFISDWRKFIRGSGRHEPPRSIDNRHLICDCEQLLYNPEDEVERSMFVAVTEDEWNILQELYKVHGVITVSRNSETGDLKIEPDICQTCYVARLEKEHKEQLTYRNAKIFIRFVQDNSDPGSDDSSSVPKKAKVNNDSGLYVPPGAGATNGCSSSAETLEVRRSSRPRRGRGEKEIVVSSDDTVRDVKLKIMQMISVMPFDQQLSKLNGERLDDHSATLSSVGIFPATTLLVKFNESAGGDASTMEFVSSAKVEAGFKGTELMKSF
nr:PREDICTED: ubiquitin carboxyl-terminal hydrolase 48-like [Bemisia tabaci]